MQNDFQLSLIGASTEIQLNARSLGMYLNPDIEGLAGLPDIRTSQGVNVGKDGGWTSAQLYEPRFISMNGVIAQTDTQSVEAKRIALASLLAEKSLLLKYVTPGGSTYTTRVVVMGFTAPIKRMANAAPYKIDLKADDPLLYDFDSEGGGLVATLNVVSPTGGFDIPFDIPFDITGGVEVTIVENTGTSSVSPIITITGPLTEPTLINQTTNQQMQILTDLSGSDVVVINTQLETITLNGADAYYLLADGFSFIEIGPGDNRMYLTSDNSGDTGYAEIEYSSGYIGI
jgi:hypothetical protein